LVSVVKFIAERGLAFRDDENVGSSRKFFQNIFKTFFQQNFKKRRCDAAMLLVTDFAAVPQIANRCHILFAS